jgi:hypothetical protein
MGTSVRRIGWTTRWTTKRRRASAGRAGDDAVAIATLLVHRVHAQKI